MPNQAVTSFTNANCCNTPLDVILTSINYFSLHIYYSMGRSGSSPHTDIWGISVMQESPSDYNSHPSPHASSSPLSFDYVNITVQNLCDAQERFRPLATPLCSRVSQNATATSHAHSSSRIKFQAQTSVCDGGRTECSL